MERKGDVSTRVLRMQEPQPQFRLKQLGTGQKNINSWYTPLTRRGRSEPPVVIERVRVAAQWGLTIFGAFCLAEKPDCLNCDATFLERSLQVLHIQVLYHKLFITRIYNKVKLNVQYIQTISSEVDQISFQMKKK
ncbi:unnamed protein product [Ceratitis capitata]|uniref:(Mediterranean fruit fly) hypothetical protein n=1 Tax=Ceratitis capitata TaxID=7213 RepID=A0A811U785_CERCA|nr:unnamed protein product [Ceratitis capitata]